MTLPRLATRFWVSAIVRRCSGLGIPATVVRHGYDEAGAVLLLARHRDGLCRLFGATTGRDDARAWLPLSGSVPVPAADADALIERQRRIDPDVWVLELETDAPEALVEERFLPA